MKIPKALFLTICLASPAAVWALPKSETPPDMVHMSAAFAKARAQMRAYGLDMSAESSVSGEEDTYDISPIDSNGGCDVNLGNVYVNDNTDTPQDVMVFVQGDIIQANNCR